MSVLYKLGCDTCEHTTPLAPELLLSSTTEKQAGFTTIVLPRSVVGDRGEPIDVRGSNQWRALHVCSTCISHLKKTAIGRKLLETP